MCGHSHQRWAWGWVLSPQRSGARFGAPTAHFCDVVGFVLIGVVAFVLEDVSIAF